MSVETTPGRGAGVLPLPAHVSLTPASDLAGDGVEISDSVSQAGGGLNASSTRASVDSESDYQVSNGPASTVTETLSSVSSHPLSRSSSTVSGTSALSTTATKDGIEGKRVRRFHDPLGYATWFKSNAPGPGEEGDQYGQTTPSDNTPSERSVGSADEPAQEQPPPNIPSAPPVTLNEKMRLLRTGSVSGGKGQDS